MKWGQCGGGLDAYYAEHRNKPPPPEMGHCVGHYNTYIDAVSRNILPKIHFQKRKKREYRNKAPSREMGHCVGQAAPC